MVRETKKLLSICLLPLLPPVRGWLSSFLTRPPSRSHSLASFHPLSLLFPLLRLFPCLPSLNISTASTPHCLPSCVPSLPSSPPSSTAILTSPDHFPFRQRRTIPFFSLHALAVPLGQNPWTCCRRWRHPTNFTLGIFQRRPLTPACLPVEVWLVLSHISDNSFH